MPKSHSPSPISHLPSTFASLRVAIVCDWLTETGGAELVVLELHRMFPKAPIYTSQYDPKRIDWFKNADVRTGWLQGLPKRFKKFYPLLRAWYFSKLDLSEYDLIISETGAEAKAVKFGSKTKHLCICNAPTHYYWSRYDTYLRNPGFSKGLNWLARIGLKMLLGPLRRWDYQAAQKPTNLIAISSHIQNEIKRYYSRESAIVHPPVDTNFFATISNISKKRSGFVITGRQTPYKRFDLAVEACKELGLPLTVLGDGPEHQNLKDTAGPTVRFLGKVSREQLREALQSAEAFIFPGLDDFGIAPVEALAAGTPVIAYENGGALDYIKPGTNGEFFFPQTLEALKHVLTHFDSTKYEQELIQKSSREFSPEFFAKKIQTIIIDNYHKQSR